MEDPLFLTSEDVADIAEMDEYIDAVYDGFRQRGEGGEADNRTVLSGGSDSDASIISYGATLPDTGVIGRYTFAPSSSTRGWFLTSLFDGDSGEPLALLDSASWNPLKTGATGAVAVDCLAREDAATLGVIGSGVQARAQALGIDIVRDLRSVNVYSPTPENRNAFVSDMGGRLDADVAAVDTSADAVADADVVVTATTATDPVFDGDRLPDGAHVNAVGQGEPGKREIDTATMRRAKYVPDHRERAVSRSGSFLHARSEGAISEDDVYAELGDVVAGTVPGRESDTEVTLFDSSGTGVEAVAAGYMLYERAKDEDVGRPVPFTPADEAFGLVPYLPSRR